MPPAWKEADLLLNGSNFHYIRTGNSDKPALVLLHGFTDSGPCWQRTARALEADYDLILPDLRGHGKSARFRAGEAVDHPADMAAFLQALGLPRPVLGGHSLGAASAAALASRFPGLVGGLVLEDPAWRPVLPGQPPAPANRWQWLLDARQKGASAEEWIALGRQMRPSWAQEEFGPWAQAKQEFDLQQLETLWPPFDHRTAAAGLQVPALLLTAAVELGAIVTPGLAREVMTLSPHLQEVNIPGAGHNIRRENFPAFMAAVQGFLQGLPR